MATGEPARSIRIYSLAGGKDVGVIQGFRDDVQSLCFSEDSSRLISGMRDTTAIVWDLKFALQAKLVHKKGKVLGATDGSSASGEGEKLTSSKVSATGSKLPVAPIQNRFLLSLLGGLI